MKNFFIMNWNQISKIGAFLLMAVTPFAANAQYNNYGQNNYNQYDNNGYNGYDDRYDNGDYSDFYDELAPHGNWMQDPQYGYVWRPNVGNDFRPYYTNGRWASTDMGNMWMSDYAWGSIPFHYGRWVMSNYYGWLWIPGRQWAPAWVVWRQSGSHYGWAPMGPSVSINFNFGNYYNNHLDYWNFIPYGNIYAGNYHRYRYHGFNSSWFGRTTIINNYYSYGNNRFFAGPRRDDVRRHVGRDFTTYRVNHTNSRGRNSINNNSIRVYSPEIRDNRSGRQIAPRNFTRIDNDKRIQHEYGRGNSRNSNRVEAPRNDRNNRNNTTIDRNRNNDRVNSNVDRSNNRNIQRNTNEAPRNNRTNTIQNRNTDRVQPNRNGVQQNRNVTQPRTNTSSQINRSQGNTPSNRNVSQQPRTNQTQRQNVQSNRNNTNRGYTQNVRDNRNVQPSRSNTTQNRSMSQPSSNRQQVNRSSAPTMRENRSSNVNRSSAPSRGSSSREGSRSNSPSRGGR